MGSPLWGLPICQTGRWEKKKIICLSGLRSLVQILIRLPENKREMGAGFWLVPRRSAPRPLPGAFLSCLGKKGSKEADRGGAELVAPAPKAALPGPLPARFSFRLCWTEDCLYWISDHSDKANLLDGKRLYQYGAQKFPLLCKVDKHLEFYLPQCGKLCETFL